MAHKKSHFSFAEVFENENGKTSGTAFVGITVSLVGTLCFFLGCIDKIWFNKDIDIITQSITFVLIGSSLMGLRKFVSRNAGIIVDNTDGKIEEGELDTPKED